MQENITNKLVKLDIAIEEMGALIDVLVSAITGTSDLETADLVTFAQFLENKMKKVNDANKELMAKFFGSGD